MLNGYFDVLASTVMDEYGILYTKHRCQTLTRMFDKNFSVCIE